MEDAVLEKLKELQGRLQRIVNEVQSNPESQRALARDMADIHAEMETLLHSMLPADQRTASLRRVD
jgi:hypothetical protein